MYISQVIYKLYMHANNEKNFWENLIYYIHLFIFLILLLFYIYFIIINMYIYMHFHNEKLF